MGGGIKEAGRVEKGKGASMGVISDRVPRVRVILWGALGHKLHLRVGLTSTKGSRLSNWGRAPPRGMWVSSNFWLNASVGPL